MTPDDVRAAADQLVQFHDRFAPLFGKEQGHAHTYLKGLISCPERKSIEPIALCLSNGQVSGLQKFIAVAPWQSDEVQAEIQSAFADELAPSAAGTATGVVGAIDESAFAKKGVHSAGVARQHNGRLGKEDNCQVGVFLIGVTPAGSALLDLRLYLPGSWYEGDASAGRRAEAHIPEYQPFRTKPQIAAEHYRRPDGTPSEELGNLKASLRPVRKLYGLTPASDFGPLAWRSVLEEMIRSGLARSSINDRVNRIRRVFRWAASIELVPASVVVALGTVAGLQKGRSEAREASPIEPVPIHRVEATLPHLPRPAWSGSSS